MTNAEFRDLVEKCLEGSATPEEERAVVDAAEASPRRARFLRLVVEFDASLHTLRWDPDAFARRVAGRLRHEGHAGAFARRLRRRIEREGAGPGFRPRRAASRRLRPRAGGLRSARWVLAAALLVAVGAAALLLRDRGPGSSGPHRSQDVAGVAPPGEAPQGGVSASNGLPRTPVLVERGRSPRPPTDADQARDPAGDPMPSSASAAKTPAAPSIPQAMPGTASAPAHTTTVIARVESVSGDVSLDVGGVFEAVEPGLALVSGRVIRTAEASRCVLRLLDGSRLEAGAATRVSVAASDAAGGPEDGGVLRIDLAGGRIEADVARRPDGRSWVFSTAHADAVVLGTRLALEVDGSRTRLDVRHGRVRFVRKTDRSELLVASGQYAVVGHRLAMGLMSLDDRVRPVPAPPPDRALLFPPDAGHVDVKLRYGAKGDGLADDTDAIQRAISDHLDTFNRLIYLPNGIYRVTRPLEGKSPDGRYHFGMQLVGQSRERTVIRLQDACPGYQDPASPRAVIRTAVRDGLEGNEGYRNAVMNLTIDTGRGNPGAVGIDFLAQGSGAIRDVTVRSGDGLGSAGISMRRRWPGPCLLRNVLVSGFDVGIDVAHREYGVTLEHVTLERQGTSGLRYDENVVAVRALVSRNACPAVVGSGSPSLLVLLDSRLTGGAPDGDAVVVDGGAVVARGVCVAGYGGSARLRGDRLPPGSVAEVCAGLPGLSPPRAPTLPVEEPPELPPDDPASWERVEGTGTIAIQKAVDAGRPVVYLPFGQYWIDRPVRVRGAVRRIVGMNSLIHPQPALGDQPVFRFESPQKAVLLEHLMGSGWIEDASPGALVLRHVYGFAYRNVKGCGPLFAEDAPGGPWILDHPQKAWLRSCTVHGEDVAFRNAGGALWILGYRTGGPLSVAETTRGGETEALGGVVYPSTRVPPDRPMFRCVDSRQLVAVAPRSYVPNGIHRLLVAETRGDALQEIETPPMPIAHATIEPDAPGPTRRLMPTPSAQAAWDARLLDRLREAIASGDRPRFACSLVGSDVEVLDVDDRGGLSIRSGAASAVVPWTPLSLEDRRRLALAVLRKGVAGDHALAAFYHLAVGMREMAEAHLRRAGSAAEEVRASFR